MFSSSREGRQTEGTGTFNIYYVQVQKVEEESGCLFASYLASHSGLTDGFLRPNDWPDPTKPNFNFMWNTSLFYFLLLLSWAEISGLKKNYRKFWWCKSGLGRRHLLGRGPPLRGRHLRVVAVDLLDPPTKSPRKTTVRQSQLAVAIYLASFYSGPLQLELGSDYHLCWISEGSSLPHCSRGRVRLDLRCQRKFQWDMKFGWKWHQKIEKFKNSREGHSLAVLGF